MNFDFFPTSVCVPQEDTSTSDNPDVVYVQPYDESNEYGDGSKLNPYNLLSIALVSLYSKYSEIRLLGEGDYPLIQIP